MKIPNKNFLLKFGTFEHSYIESIFSKFPQNFRINWKDQLALEVNPINILTNFMIVKEKKNII